MARIAARTKGSYKKRKLMRLRKGGKPRVLDLFAGCGGLSLGFHKAGFEIASALETDPLAIRSHALNFYKGHSDNDIEKHSTPHDIVELGPKELISSFGLGSKKTSIDVIVGGPPCQAYARVGRAKLREIHDHPQAFLRDPRKNLYLRFLHYIEELEPLAVLVENVPDALNIAGHNTAEEMCEVLSDIGYECNYTLLNASFYGVPQMRERMFLVAYAKELGANVEFPSPTHWTKLPVGYKGSRNVALRHLKEERNGQKNLFKTDTHYVSPPKPSSKLKPAVTAKDALKDLPPITLHLEGLLRRGARRFDTAISYPRIRSLNGYARTMRDWPGFEARDGLFDHVIRSLPRDYPIFQRMNPGDQYPEAHQHAIDLLDETVSSLRENNERVGPVRYEELKTQMVPPYDPTKFPNKWRKLEADMPSRTLLAHIGKDTYSHIHYDSDQARTISVREAARLQSFPDGFIFAGTMNPAFRQIGNAVPPILAEALAVTMLKAIRGRKG